MSVWSQYTKEQQEIYKRYIEIYGSLSKLFRQKQGDMIPYLDSKFQETVYAKSFQSKVVDIGNTPHDVLSVFGNQRIGIGLKTWMNSNDSFQKVMQLKSYRKEIESVLETKDEEQIAYKLSEIKNARMKQDYLRLGLNEDSNIYHYVTRDKEKMVLQECAYPLIDLSNLRDMKISRSSFVWSDGIKEYRFTYADSQIWQKFSISNPDTTIVDQVNIKIMDDPFTFLLEAYMALASDYKADQEEYEVAYLPLYSYREKEVMEKSGLNAWNAAPKTKGSDILRPDREIYIPIPRQFHRKFPDFFTPKIQTVINQRKALKEVNRDLEPGEKVELPQIRFTIVLPNGQEIPGLVTADNLKQFQSGGYLNGKKYGQSDLGNWLLNEVLDLGPRELVTKEWLELKDTDSIKIWRKKDDYSTFYIDFAAVNSFELFMNGEDPESLVEE